MTPYSLPNPDSQKRTVSVLSIVAIVAASLALAACSSSPKTQSKSHKNKFAPSKYGVKGSPKVVSSGKRVPKGGGRYMVGRPYKIAGKMYYPKKYRKRHTRVGSASWYGPTFHGRRTANGEIFDMNALTAAHPTMPLPSYARVTNLRNGRSVIVRVNDRGPFHGNRIIDLSKRTAQTLDFGGRGTQKVRVVYLGRARLDGLDESYLSASYRGPGSTNAPPTMVANLDNIGPAPVPMNRPFVWGNSAVRVAFDPATSYGQTRVASTFLAFNSPRPSNQPAPVTTQPAVNAAATPPPATYQPPAATGGPLILMAPGKSTKANIRKRRLQPFPASYAPIQRISAGHAAITQVVAREQAWRQIMALPVDGQR